MMSGERIEVGAFDQYVGCKYWIEKVLEIEICISCISLAIKPAISDQNIWTDGEGEFSPPVMRDTNRTGW